MWFLLLNGVNGKGIARHLFCSFAYCSLLYSGHLQKNHALKLESPLCEDSLEIMHTYLFGDMSSSLCFTLQPEMSFRKQSPVVVVNYISERE